METMADRFFPNDMLNYIPEATVIASSLPESGDSLTRLLHLPYKSVCEILKKTALVIKDAVYFCLFFLGFLYFELQLLFLYLALV